MTGTVKFFDSKRGFGFINGSDGKEMFVHFSQIDSKGFKTLRDGERVEYELGEGRNGKPMAVSVKPIL